MKGKALGALFLFFLLLGGAEGAGEEKAVLLPLYTYDVGEWVKAAELAERYRVIAIINPDSGPGEGFSAAIASLLAFLKANGITAIGYVPTAYGDRPIGEVKEDIDRYWALYRSKGLAIEGIFFDEVDEEDVAYYHELKGYAESLGFRENWFNPGTMVGEEFQRAFPSVIYEGPCSGISPEDVEGVVRGAFLCYGYSQGDGERVKEVWERLGVGYATEDSLPNPWDSVSLSMLSLADELHKGAELPQLGYYTKDGRIWKGREEVKLFGVNWFGFETGDGVVHGLWARNWEDMLEQMKGLGFNAIRLPFCTYAVDPWEMPREGLIREDLNPDIAGLPSLAIMHRIVEKANELGMYVLLDYHSIECGTIEELWYTDDFSEENFTDVWRWVAYNFRNYPNVMGADLKNEPHGAARWGSGDGVDWRLAAERIGREVLEVAPHWLIFVEGTQYSLPELDNYSYGENTFWGENLRGVSLYPVRLPFSTYRNKVVYSPHVYGPDVAWQPYFAFLGKAEKVIKWVWDQHFGYLAGREALAIGEFGGRFGEGHELDDEWQRLFVSYLMEKGICNFFYWSWNPNSGDTGGLLEEDWESVEWAKYWNVRRLMDHCRGGPVLHTKEVVG